ncbi:MAG: AEC family transporter [Thermodesulfobacteriota bacterium]
MTNFILIFICLAAGQLLQRRADIEADEAARSLNLYVIYVALPALVLAQVPGLSFSPELWIVIAMPWLMVAWAVLLLLACQRLFNWPRAVMGCLLLCVPLANTSFLGIPMVTAFFGPEYVGYAVIYDQLGSFVALSTYGTFILAIYGGQERPTPKGMIKKIITFPPFIALLCGLALRGVEMPGPLAAALSQVGVSLVPAVMVAVGLQLKIRLPGHFRAPFYTGLAIKLIAAPLLALSLYRTLAPESGGPGQIAVFEAGMPPMITAGALAIAAGLAPELAAALVGWGIVLSFASLSGLFLLL